MNNLEQWKQRVRKFKFNLYTIYLAYRDPRVPFYLKILAVLVLGYAFSPIDFIPDFIPILGYLDDLFLIPLGILLILKLMPQEILIEYEEKAQALLKESKPKNWVAAFIIILVWVMLAYLLFGAKLGIIF